MNNKYSFQFRPSDWHKINKFHSEFMKDQYHRYSEEYEKEMAFEKERDRQIALAQRCSLDIKKDITNLCKVTVL